MTTLSLLETLDQPASDSPSDGELLRHYFAHGQQAAFTTLVRRHVNVVYSAALRQVRNAALAEDVTQAVFLVLAKKGSALCAHPAIGGWLVNVTRFAAIDALRRQAATVRHEQAAARPEAIPNPLWATIEPVLDHAMARLAHKDRTAVVLRYFDGRSFAEMSQLLQMTESAARKRTARAIAKLRRLLASEAPMTSLSEQALLGALAQGAVVPAPGHLAAHIAGLVHAGHAAGSATLISHHVLTLLRWKLWWGGAGMGGGAIAAGTLAAAVAIIPLAIRNHTAPRNAPRHAPVALAAAPIASTTPAAPPPADIPIDAQRILAHLAHLHNLTAQATQENIYNPMQVPPPPNLPPAVQLALSHPFVGLYGYQLKFAHLDGTVLTDTRADAALLEREKKEGIIVTHHQIESTAGDLRQMLQDDPGRAPAGFLMALGVAGEPLRSQSRAQILDGRFDQALGLRAIIASHPIDQDFFGGMTLSRLPDGLLQATHDFDAVGYRYVYRFDPQRDYALVYAAAFVKDGTPYLEITPSDFKPVSGIDLPFTMVARFSTRDQGTLRASITTTWKVSSYKLDDPANTAETIKMPWPDGTQVTDEQAPTITNFIAKNGTLHPLTSPITPPPEKPSDLP